jgi:phospholipid/cholesterol/gamma-HCH transport system ATP-binding protein
MPVIQASNLTKRFGSQTVLDQASLTVESAEIVFIVGASGSGKSVFLEHLMGLQSPDEGSVKIEGEEIVGLDEEKLFVHRRKIGYLFQQGALYDFMTVRENLELPLREHMNLKEAEIQQRVDEAFEQVGLKDIDKKNPSQISGGMLKRAALARAIILKPKFLFCDEPTSGLDPITAALINQLIKDCQKKYNMTALVVSHDIKSVSQIAGRVAYLKEGRFCFIGKLDDFFKSDEPSVKEFINEALVGGAKSYEKFSQ